MTPFPCLHETDNNAATPLVELLPPMNFRQEQEIGEHDVLLGRDKRTWVTNDFES